MNYDHLSDIYNDYLEHYGVKGMKWGVVNETKKTAATRIGQQLAAASRKAAGHPGGVVNELRLRAGIQSTKNDAATSKQSSSQAQAFTKRFGNTDSKTVRHTGPNGNTTTRQYARFGTNAAQKIISEHGAIGSTYYSGGHYSSVKADTNLGAVVYVEGEQTNTIWGELVDDANDGIVDNRPDAAEVAIKSLSQDMSSTLKKAMSSNASRRGSSVLKSARTASTKSKSPLSKALSATLTKAKSSIKLTASKATKTVKQRGKKKS